MNGCHLPLSTGVCVLADPVLGELDLTTPGYVVGSIEVGAPAARIVARNRALGDGMYDESRYLGGRSVTLGLTLNNRVPNLSTQQLIDLLAPFTSPRYRPTLRWSLADSPADVRSLAVIGSGLPVGISGPKYQGVVVNFRSPDAYLGSADVHCQTIGPSQTIEEGRTYDLSFDRSYPPSEVIGGFRITNLGNAPADWTMTIFGATTNPRVQVGSELITFDENGGVDLLEGQTLQIDTAAQTMLLDGDPAESRYNRANFLDWEWDQLRLPQGDTLVRFDADTLTVDSQATICWQDRWL